MFCRVSSRKMILKTTFNPVDRFYFLGAKKVFNTEEPFRFILNKLLSGRSVGEQNENKNRLFHS